MSVEFEPVKIGQPRRRLDAVSIGAVVVAIALAAAILKPWNVGSEAGDAGAAAEASAQPAGSTAGTASLTGPHSTAEVALPRILRSGSASSPTWADIEPVVRRHEDWGIRAIVIKSSTDAAPSASGSASANQRFAERWIPLTFDAVEPSAYVDSSDRSIVALGITFPTSHTPLDVRIWRVGSAGLEWVDTAALDSLPSGGGFLYARPGIVGGSTQAWAAGTYRVDVLVDGSIRRFGVTIPDRFSNVPAPSGRPSLRDVGELIDPGKAPLPDLPIGLFATVDGVAVPLPADEGPPLDEAAAWLDVDPGTRRAPRRFVAAEYLPRANGLGVMLPPGSVVQSASIARLAPEPLAAVPQQVEDGAATGAPASHVLFHAPDGRAWVPGTYQLSVVWADADGLHDRSWHAELRPGPLQSAPRMLAAARGWARYAGATGVILGTAEPLEGGPRGAAIRLLRISPEPETAYPAPSGVGCGGTVVDGRPGILGFAYPADHYVTAAGARILLPYLRRDDQVMMTAAFGIPGLILVAPARSPTLASATYRFTVGNGEDTQSYAICLGMALFDD